MVSRSKDSANPGKFIPQRPIDSFGVLRLFAVASRAVCAKPERFQEINESLRNVVSDLVPPESLAVSDCEHLWEIFRRFASHPKATLRIEAARALCRDLDTMGQRLQLPPLPNWENLPDFLIETQLAVAERDSIKGVQEILAEAKLLHASLGPGEQLSEEVIVELLWSMDGEARGEFVLSLVGTGNLSRNEAALLTRWLSSDKKLESDDYLLVEVLGRVGAWLVK